MVGFVWLFDWICVGGVGFESFVECVGVVVGEWVLVYGIFDNGYCRVSEFRWWLVFL